MEENESDSVLEIDLQMRDTVVVVAPGRLQHTVGVITGIEGDLCRLHVKVNFRLLIVVLAIVYNVYHRLKCISYLCITCRARGSMKTSGFHSATARCSWTDTTLCALAWMHAIVR